MKYILFILVIVMFALIGYAGYNFGRYECKADLYTLKSLSESKADKIQVFQLIDCLRSELSKARK